jgi:hypothetical protein
VRPCFRASSPRRRWTASSRYNWVLTMRCTYITRADVVNAR